MAVEFAIVIVFAVAVEVAVEGLIVNGVSGLIVGVIGISRWGQKCICTRTTINIGFRLLIDKSWVYFQELYK